MRNSIILMFCLTYLSGHGQEANAGFDPHTWKSPYYLSKPKDWSIERFPIPISFAPQILYKGIEDIRFAPGWAKAASEEYWTYAFLWYLDGSVKMDEKIIGGNLKAYYTGLFRVNTDSTKIDATTLPPVITSFKKASTDKDDLETYSGTIEMTDYMQRKPITLNCKVHVGSCPESNKTIVFYELSPKPFTHNNWVSLDQLWLDFKCKAVNESK